MNPNPNERLKVARFEMEGGPYFDITNDAGDPSEEFSILEPPDEETARRLVALWNACRGISTEHLETAASYPTDSNRLGWMSRAFWHVARTSREQADAPAGAGEATPGEVS